MAKHQVKVKNYTRRRAMERHMAKMLGDGWRVEQQSGRFSHPFAVFPKRVTVTYVRER